MIEVQNENEGDIEKRKEDKKKKKREMEIQKKGKDTFWAVASACGVRSPPNGLSLYCF